MEQQGLEPALYYGDTDGSLTQCITMPAQESVFYCVLLWLLCMGHLCPEETHGSYLSHWAIGDSLATVCDQCLVYLPDCDNSWCQNKLSPLRLVACSCYISTGLDSDSAAYSFLPEPLSMKHVDGGRRCFAGTQHASFHLPFICQSEPSGHIPHQDSGSAAPWDAVPNWLWGVLGHKSGSWGPCCLWENSNAMHLLCLQPFLELDIVVRRDTILGLTLWHGRLKYHLHQRHPIRAPRPGWSISDSVHCWYAQERAEDGPNTWVPSTHVGVLGTWLVISAWPYPDAMAVLRMIKDRSPPVSLLLCISNKS